MIKLILILLLISVKSLIVENVAVDYLPKYEEGGFISYDKSGERKDMSVIEINRKYLK